MREGLYESLLTERLRAGLAAVGLEADVAKVDSAESPEVLARYVAAAVKRTLSNMRDEDRRVALANHLLEVVGDGDPILAGPEQLVSLLAPPVPGRFGLSGRRPSTPLSDAALLTNANGEPALGGELRAEIDSADRVDLLCAFVRWHGLRVVESELRALRDRGGRMRVITTTYLGSTERLALDRLVEEFGAKVQVQYDAQRTRLHAKAWLFHRETGFDTAYVGSSNLSRAALLDGVEWNVRLSSVATPALLQKFEATFETYWADQSYEPYDPERDRDKLDDALAEASGRSSARVGVTTVSGLELQARPHQTRMLEQLEVERVVHDRHRNLVVAATGTGKTVLAALDYRRLVRGRRPRLLFVAHRREILEQSLRTYREALGDGSFGELYVGGARPERWQHVFASVQSLTSYGVTNIPSDAFEVVVIDEFHHAEASTYRRLLDHLSPAELIGLTATPERADGMDVRSYFGGRSACELALWEALEDDLLVPFHYFGIADNTNLSRIEWRRGRYDEAELSALYTGNAARTRIVLRELRDKVADLDRMRALGFCVSVAHASYMATVFTEAGIPAVAVSGQTPTAERGTALADLRDRRVNAIFAADLFNEGVDIPSVDTVLFLRPTESATLFLQQLGRGLRHAPDKPVLTALDFVGHHHKQFRFDLRYRALTGATRRGLARQVEAGFPFLPSGSQIILDRVTAKAVIESVKSQMSSRWQGLVGELRAHPTASLEEFLAESGAELADIVRDGRSWTRLRRDAGVQTSADGPYADRLLKRGRALVHVDDPQRAAAYLAWLAPDAPPYDGAPPELQAYGRMLFFSLWPDGGGFTTYAEGLAILRREPAAADELRQLVALGRDRAVHLTKEAGLAGLALRVHGRYTREEALAALDYVHLGGRKPNSFREGVLFADPWQADAFFVTLKKAETDYSPTTLYRDYAISPSLFHWESQSNTSVASPTGQRYLHHRDRGTHVLLFSRPMKITEFGSGAPYLFLGTAKYMSHRGERPISITWSLDVPMPADAFTEAAVAVA